MGSIARKGQVSPGTLIAFGISITSRDGRADELRELLDFAETLSNTTDAILVSEAYYCSVKRTCSFSFVPGITPEEEALVLAAAQLTLTRFEWQGSVRRMRGPTGAWLH